MGIHFEYPVGYIKNIYFKQSVGFALQFEKTGVLPVLILKLLLNLFK